MSAEASTAPALSRSWRPLFQVRGVAAAARVPGLLSNPNLVAAILWGAGAVAVTTVLPLRHWSGRSLFALAAVAGVQIGAAVVRITVGPRLPAWSLQVDVALWNVLASVVSATAASGHVGLANLYLLVAVFAVLYLPFRAMLAHTVAAGVVWALILALGPRPVESPEVAWLAVFGSVAVLDTVVLGLVRALRLAAREDPLTGLANLRSFGERLEEELERARRAGTALSALVIDLDGFKAVNDRLGHQAGDELLQEVARSWLALTRHGGDFLARLGGDEFALLAPGADATGLRRLSERLADALPAGVSASVGMATWDGAESASDMVRRADHAMYDNKLHRRRQRAVAPPERAHERHLQMFAPDSRASVRSESR